MDITLFFKLIRYFVHFG